MSRPILLLVLGLAACAGPNFEPATAVPAPPRPAQATDSAGAFQLDFEVPRRQWAEGEAITGEARLALTRGTAVVFSGSGNPLGFEFREVGGDRWIEPVWTADCAVHSLNPGEAMRTEIRKSGASNDDDPNAGFYRDFLSDPLVRLPRGQWDVTAIALFNEGKLCDGVSRELRATVRVQVGN